MEKYAMLQGAFKNYINREGRVSKMFTFVHKEKRGVSLMFM